MRKFMFVVFAFVVGCAAPPEDGTSCTVENQDDGALITCEDGTTAFVANGQDGTDGVDGANGSDASNCLVNNFDGFTCISCPNSPEVCFDHAKFCGEHAHLADDVANTCYCDSGYQLVGQDCLPDICTQNEWYWDGVCDRFCPDPDPDCSRGKRPSP